jgi:hypothetical protein
MSDLIRKSDLTRWNRAGLRRFRYVDGNAITFLEALRLALAENFTGLDGKNQWEALDTAIPVPAGEDPAERQARWIAQYHDDRRDHAWEIVRALARSSHVLSEYLNACANEGYLRTATQWDNVRRLVEMLDYHPAPPASARTPIALEIKDGRDGIVETGFAFKNQPPDGGKPAVFETLADLAVDHRMNGLRAAEWNRSQEAFHYSGGTADFPLAEPVAGVSVESLGILLVETDGGTTAGVAVRVKEVTDAMLKLEGESGADLPADIRRHQVRLLLKPDFKAAPRLTGSNVAVLAEGHGLSIDSVAAWNNGGWSAARVIQVGGNHVQFSGAAPPEGADLYLAAESEARMLKIDGTDEHRIILPPYQSNGRETWALFDGTLNRIHSFYLKSESGTPLYDYLDGDVHATAWYVPTADPVAEVIRSDPQSLELDGDPGDLATGDWLVAKIGGDIRAASIKALTEGEKHYTLELSKTLSNIDTLYGNFELDIRPLDHDINETPIFLAGSDFRSDAHSTIPLELEIDEYPDLLDIGRELIVAGKDDAMAVVIQEVDLENGRIRVSPAIPGSETFADGTTDVYTRHDTKIYGNVVLSGHGETQKEKVIGSGDASVQGQQFDFDVEKVSFVSDPAFPSGVRAAVEVTVGDRTWRQQPTLNNSAPEDPHYTVRPRSDGGLTVDFGDGRRGRRLPTGGSNVRIGYRKGTGTSGNLDPYSLKKEVKPHWLIAGIVQPIPGAGGNDMEAAEAMRENAPAGVLALERAVSLSDFTHLAARNSSVWQAKAFRRRPGRGRTERIEVAVVPAGGGELGTLGAELKAFLADHALPGVTVNVVPYEGIILDLKLTLRIKTDQYDPEAVADAVEETVFSAFSLENARLGAPLFRSRVFEVVEGVAGVENCECRINPWGFRDADGDPATPRRVDYGATGAVRRVQPTDIQVIYMDAGSELIIETEPFSL